VGGRGGGAGLLEQANWDEGVAHGGLLAGVTSLSVGSA
jgi:hypothetical protein